MLYALQNRLWAFATQKLKLPPTALLLFGWAFLAIVLLPLYFVDLKQGYSFAFADLLFWDSALIDLFEHHGKWSSWSMSPAPAYIPDFLLYLPAYFLLHHTMDRVFFVSVSHAFLMAGLAILLIRSLVPEKRTNAYLFALSVAALLSYCAYTSQIWLYFNSTNSHMGGYLLSVLCLVLLLKVVRSSARRYSVALAFAVGASFISAKNLFVVWFIAPALITFFLLFLIVLMKNWWSQNGLSKPQNALLPVVTICGGWLTGKFLEPYITCWDTMELIGRTVGAISMQRMNRSWQATLRALIEVFQNTRLSYLVLRWCWMIGVVITLIWLICETRKVWQLSTKLNDTISKDPIFVHLIFTLVSLLLTPFAVTLSGDFRSILDFRYYMVPIALPIINLIAYISRKSQNIFEHPLVGIIFVIPMCLISIYLLTHFQSFKERNLTVAQVRSYEGTWERQLADCLDANKEAYSLQYGVADFWASRPTNLFSKKGIRVYPIDGGSLQPRHYMSNIDWFLGENAHRFNKPFYNFVVLSHGIDAREVILQVGKPQRQFTCHDGVQILVYDDASTLDATFKSKSRAMIESFQFQKGTRNDLTLDANSLKTIIGLKSGSTYQARPQVQQNGVLSYGPAIPFLPGDYEFTLSYDTVPASNETKIGDWDVFVWPDKTFEAGSIYQTSRGDGVVQGKFHIGRENRSERIEIRSHFLGIQPLTIKELKIRRVSRQLW